MQKIKVNFLVPTEDFKNAELCPLNVSMNIDADKVLNGQFEYKVVIPDYMFNELANTEPQFTTEHNHNIRNVSGCFGLSELTRKFKKTQTSTNIDVLTNYFRELTAIINAKYSIETQTMKKKIFISFEHNERHISNGLNGAYWGEILNQTFHYFTGYEVMTDKYNLHDDNMQKKYITKIEYHSVWSTTRSRDTGFSEGDRFLPLPKLNQRITDFETQFSIIDWTPEREAFCEQINQMFKKVNGDLSDFLKNLDNNKFEQLMTSGNIKLIN
jgi:hypothetical protein